jgi:HD superfamily phosphodiesterase
MTGEDGLVKVLKTAGRLKKEMRRGWVVKAGIPNPESVADHTFRTVLLAMLLGDSRHFDTEKMMRMALIHDLGYYLHFLNCCEKSTSKYGASYAIVPPRRRGWWLTWISWRWRFRRQST